MSDKPKTIFMPAFGLSVLAKIGVVAGIAILGLGGLLMQTGTIDVTWLLVMLIGVVVIASSVACNWLRIIAWHVRHGSV